MRYGLVFSFFLCVVFLCGVSSEANSQDQIETFRVQVGGPYQLQKNYSILYDSTVQPAKLKDFRVLFYDSEGQVIAQAPKETHPVTGNIETYNLTEPVIGFSEIGLAVLSLHSGIMTDFPENIGEIVGMDRTIIAAPEPEDPEVQDEDSPNSTLSDIEPVTQATVEATLPPPGLTEADRQRLADMTQAADKLLSVLSAKSDVFETEFQLRRADTDRMDQLLQDTALMSAEVEKKNLFTLSEQIAALNSEILQAKQAAELTGKQADLRNYASDVLELKTQIKGLEEEIQIAGTDINNLVTSFEPVEGKLTTLETLIADTTLPGAVTQQEITSWETRYAALINQIPTPLNWTLLAGSAIIGLLVLGFIIKALLGSQATKRPLKTSLNTTQSAGVIFPASPLLAGNVAAPLSAAGQLTASQLQMLTGPYAVLRSAYQATGRIGYAQTGVPTSEDYAFGTGFLISDRHVITNRHVHGLYGHYLLDETDPGGIEFIAEKDKDSSDFVPFNCEPPLLLPALDIAIYTLARPVKDRTPIPLATIETNIIHGREIVVIGYPDTHTPEAEDIKAVVEENAVFAVKRISQGHIFRHSTDVDTPIGVKTEVSEDKHNAFTMPAICHNASTLSGNSGSPLLDIKTGELLGVHFAGFKAFNQEEAANLAMAVAQLTNETSQKHLSGVTKITA